MKFHTALVCMSVAGALAISTPAQASDEHVAPIQKFVQEQVMPWLNDTVVVDSIIAQNQKHERLSDDDITKLDKKWRAEVTADTRPLVESLLANKLSEYLSTKKDGAGGMITEMFVMDNKGLNVGQSDPTSDYWQGDEAKWKKTYGSSTDTVFVDEVEMDESTQTLQSQASVAIKDPKSGKFIGAITIGINLDAL